VLAGLCACSVGAFACSFGYPGRGITTMVLGFVLVHLGVRQAVPRAAPAEFLTFVALSFGGSSFFLPLFRIPIVPRIPGFGQGPIGWGGALPALAALVGIVYGAVALALYRGRDELPDWGKKLAQVSVLAAMPALLVWGTMWLSGSGCR